MPNPPLIYTLYSPNIYKCFPWSIIMGKKRRKNSLHEKIKKEIKSNPGLLGLSKIIDVKEEVPCIGNDGNTVREPDLIFYLENGQKVLVEIKSTDNPNTLKSLEEQLHGGYWYFKDYHNEEYHCIGAYRDKKGNLRWAYRNIQGEIVYIKNLNYNNLF